MTTPPPLHFWDVAPKPSIFSYFKTALFGPSNIDTPPTRLACSPHALNTFPQSPAGTSKWQPLPAKRVHEYCDFLQQYFVTSKSGGFVTSKSGGGGGGGGGPLYILEPSHVLHQMKEYSLRPIIVCDKKTHAIIGCIASIAIGQLRRNGEQPATPFNTRIIRDFCVHPSFRSAGLGSYLLFSVWEDTRAIGEDAVLFLKEGRPIGRAGPSLTSSSWIYRRMRDSEDVSRVQRVPWSALPHELKTFTQGRADVIFNIPGKAPLDSVALIYKTFRGAILASFTHSHQIHPSDGEYICYENGWLEKGELLDAEKHNAALQLSAAAAAILGCYWVWCNRRSPPEGPWLADGQYHWYAFHWTPGFYGNVALWLVL